MKIKLFLILIIFYLNSSIYSQELNHKVAFGANLIISNSVEDYLDTGYGIKGKIQWKLYKDTDFLIEISYVDWPKTERLSYMTVSVNKASATILNLGIIQNFILGKLGLYIFGTTGILFRSYEHNDTYTYNNIFTGSNSTRKSNYSGDIKHFNVSTGIGIEYGISETFYLDTNVGYNYVTFDKSFYGVNIGIKLLAI